MGIAMVNQNYFITMFTSLFPVQFSLQNVAGFRDLVWAELTVDIKIGPAPQILENLGQLLNFWGEIK